MRHLPRSAAIFFGALALLCSSWQSRAQTPASDVSTDWQALGWTLPKSFGPGQIALFEGLNAARGTWSFEAKTIDGDSTTAVSGTLITTGSAQGGMVSGWNLIWAWPAENPRHVVFENVVAMPEEEQFGLMLVRFAPTPYSEAKLRQKPKGRPTIFEGQWDAKTRTLSWTSRAQAAPAPGFEMVVALDGKISIQNSKNLSSGQIVVGRAKVRTGEAPKEPEFLTGMHRIAKGSEISDPRITRYLPAAATDIKLISDRNGHMAHYRITAEAFDAFLVGVWERYREESTAQPKSWEQYSKEDISAAQKGAPAGRHTPTVRSTEVVWDTPIVWESLENATRYRGPRKRSAAGATYYFDREVGIAFHDAGYW